MNTEEIREQNRVTTLVMQALSTIRCWDEVLAAGKNPNGSRLSESDRERMMQELDLYREVLEAYPEEAAKHNRSRGVRKVPGEQLELSLT